MAIESNYVYKNEDVNNPEYATIEEVQQAFFGRGVFIKTSIGEYEQVISFSPKSLLLTTKTSTYKFVNPTKPTP